MSENKACVWVCVCVWSLFQGSNLLAYGTVWHGKCCVFRRAFSLHSGLIVGRANIVLVFDFLIDYE